MSPKPDDKLPGLDELSQQLAAEIDAGIQQCIADMPELDAEIQQLLDAVPLPSLEAL